ncbi:50S ribosomal protein L3 [Methanonatronarchaeum sp. AMET-Sl]|uniref:50S ribosomal protein L3 n=1 Tax=Methanonatronarchaeum sp. AMET-Sl TaxID=3037654 RepID=UPI00244DFB7E|nr:50S ribosomal protein L3 [Methanonatronarchaeum sp. AMET-Sl]WGI17235.1 50S ribosomal protein L3 [Methanonatronarchaeum sp. AMET-Sl]
MVKKNRPRKGSLAYSPRKRSSSEVPRVRAYPEKDENRLLGFVGYKAGMTDVVMVDDRPNSMTEGTEISVPATVIETPEVIATKIRGYRDTQHGMRPLVEAEAEEFDLIEEESNEGNIDELRVTIKTSPELVSGIPKKKPDMMEIPLGGTLESQIEYAKKILGEKIKVSEIFENGVYVDVSAVTKGKGTEGPVKRWGVKIQDRKSQRKGKGRHIGNLGPWHPTHVRWQVPQTGQKGYHQRTELNKRILMIDEDASKINPDGGFTQYGEIENEYILLKGSVPGPTKRMVRIRDAIRPKGVEGQVELKHVSTESKQGV